MKSANEITSVIYIDDYDEWSAICERQYRHPCARIPEGIEPGSAVVVDREELLDERMAAARTFRELAAANATLTAEKEVAEARLAEVKRVVEKVERYLPIAKAIIGPQDRTMWELACEIEAALAPPDAEAD